MVIGALFVVFLFIDTGEEEDLDDEVSFDFDSECIDENSCENDCENASFYSPDENEDSCNEEESACEGGDDYTSDEVEDMEISSAQDFYASESSEDVSDVSSKGEVIELTEAQYKQLVADFAGSKMKYKGNKPCVVDFYATWCGPCKQLSPILDKMAKKYAGKVLFYKVDIDNASNLVSAYGIESIPTLLFGTKGSDVELISGLPSESELSQKIKSKL